MTNIRWYSMKIKSNVDRLWLCLGAAETGHSSEG